MSSDRLSRLPEDIVLQILSLLPTKLSVRTSVLSKRWRYRWTLVTNLDFDDIKPIRGVYVLTKFVDRVVKHCKASQINLFGLHFLYHSVPSSSVSNWINEAIKLNVKELDIQVHKLGLPLSMFTCKTITKLRIHCSVYDTCLWKFSCEVNLPCLKTLDVAIYSNPCINAFKGWLNIDDDYQFNIPTLKRLKVKRLKESRLVKNVVLVVPNLEYLFVGGALCSVFEMKDVSSLVEASISFSQIISYHVWVELLKGLTGVKSLSVQILSSSIVYKTLLTSPLPIFLNLNELYLKVDGHTGLILQFLESSPELKHLYIEEVVDLFFVKPKEYGWVELNLVPACVLTKLTSIKFSPCKWRNCDLSFLKYVLGNARRSQSL